MAREKNELYGGRKGKSRIVSEWLTARNYRGSSYERVFEDYSYTAEKGRNNRERLVRQYEGDTYCADVPRRRWILSKLLYALLLIAAICSFVSAGNTDIHREQSWYMVLLEMLNAIGLLWMIVKMLVYAMAKNRMTVGEYKTTSLALIRSSCFSSAVFGLTAICAAVLTLAALPGDRAAMLWYAARCAVSCACMLSVCLMEKKMKYRVCPGMAHKETGNQEKPLDADDSGDPLLK